MTAPRPQLTERELQVLTGIARGLTDDAIAAELYLAPLTIKTHRGKIYRKLAAKNAAHAVAWAYRLGILR